MLTLFHTYIMYLIERKLNFLNNKVQIFFQKWQISFSLGMCSTIFNLYTIFRVQVSYPDVVTGSAICNYGEVFLTESYSIMSTICLLYVVS